MLHFGGRGLGLWVFLFHKVCDRSNFELICVVFHKPFYYWFVEEFCLHSLLQDQFTFRIVGLGPSKPPFYVALQPRLLLRVNDAYRLISFELSRRLCCESSNVRGQLLNQFWLLAETCLQLGVFFCSLLKSAFQVIDPLLYHWADVVPWLLQAPSFHASLTLWCLLSAIQLPLILWHLILLKLMRTLHLGRLRS